MAVPREQFNCRLPAFTKAQIAELAERLGLSQSEVVMLAVERLASSKFKPKQAKSKPAPKDEQQGR